MPQLPVACFAPPLTDELLDQYAALIDGLPKSQAEIADAMRTCLAACRAWWEIPESRRTDGPQFKLEHRGLPLTVRVTPLEADQVKQLDATTPWPYECDAIQRLFDGLPSGTAEETVLRNAAFHLLWHAKELSKDREPLTNDKL